MCVCKVGDVDIVSDAGAVMGGIIVTEDVDLFPLAVGHLQDERNKVAFRVVGFTDFSAGVCACCVEIAECNILHAVCLVIAQGKF